MKPEQNRGTDKGGDELKNDEGVSNAVQLTEDEKAVLNLLKANSPMDLNAVKEQTGNKLAKVEKTQEGLFVSVV